MSASICLSPTPYPDALDGASEALRKRRTGKAAFNFPDLDNEMERDLEGCWRVYMSGIAPTTRA